MVSPSISFKYVFFHGITTNQSRDERYLSRKRRDFTQIFFAQVGPNAVRDGDVNRKDQDSQQEKLGFHHPKRRWAPEITHFERVGM